MKKVVFLFGLLLTPATTIFSQSLLDTTFGVAGRFIYNFSTSSYARLQSTALLPNGKIIAVGETSDSSRRAAALRCHANGTLDTSFGNQGEWISDDPNFVIANNVIIQPDGKILLVGYNYVYFIVVRLLPDGTNDPSFGVSGKAYFSVWPGSDLRTLYDLILQPDGKILVCGFSTDNDVEAMITRLNSNGTLDSSFGTFGKIIIKPEFFNANRVFISRIGLNGDGQILASGFYTINGQASVGFVLKYQNNGQQDMTFGESGVARFQHPGPIGDIFVLPTNHFLVLCGIYDTATFNLTTTLIKWKADGKVDSSFANKGYASFPVVATGHNTPRNGFLQPDGGVMVFGNWHSGKGFLGRFNEDGSIDKTLGINGTIISSEYYADGFVQPDGKIVTAGPYIFGGPFEKASILRYLGSNTVGMVDVPASVSSMLIYPNPVSGQTLNIAYELPDAAKVIIELLDLQGQKQSTLLSTDRPKGKNEEPLSLPADLNNGCYLLHIRTNKGDAMIKLSVIRP